MPLKSDFLSVAIAAAVLLTGFLLPAHASENSARERREAVLDAIERGVTAVPDIAAALSDSEAFVRRTAAHGLTRFGDEAGEAMAGALTHPDREVRRISMEGLHRAGALTPRLGVVLADEDPFVRRSLDRILARMDADDEDSLDAVLGALQAFFRQTEGEERRVVAGQLYTFDGERVARVLDAVSLPAEGWRFRLDPERRGRSQEWFAPGYDDAGWESIAIEQPWQKVGHDYIGVAWYRRSFENPSASEANAAELHFSGVDETAWVWLNGEYVGEHDLGPRGWEIPFHLDVSDAFHWRGENRIAVKVMNTAGQGGIYREIVLKLFERVR